MAPARIPVVVVAAAGLLWWQRASQYIPWADASLNPGGVESVQHRLALAPSNSLLSFSEAGHVVSIGVRSWPMVFEWDDGVDRGRIV